MAMLLTTRVVPSIGLSTRPPLYGLIQKMTGYRSSSSRGPSHTDRHQHSATLPLLSLLDDSYGQQCLHARSRSEAVRHSNAYALNSPTSPLYGETSRVTSAWNQDNSEMDEYHSNNHTPWKRDSFDDHGGCDDQSGDDFSYKKNSKRNNNLFLETAHLLRSEMQHVALNPAKLQLPLYDEHMTFVDSTNGLEVQGVKMYFFVLKTFATGAKIYFNDPKFNLIWFQRDSTNQTVRCRWQICGTPRMPLSIDTGYYDRISTFFICDHGLIREHRIDRCEPLDDGYNNSHICTNSFDLHAHAACASSLTFTPHGTHS
eukprot:m.14055 g.14055  ORF g.14055 m.14055 type:complete len:314 (-) comp9993_c0_seq2:138-1079(-)